MSTLVRLASSTDIDSILAIDWSATKKFSSIPALADLATHGELPEKVQQWLEMGRIYLAAEASESLGFIAVHAIESCVHINEVAVSIKSQRNGIGAMLLSAIKEWAVDLSNHAGATSASVTLTTYPDVPWNGPWYRKHGFVEVDARTVGPWLVAIEEEERDLLRPGYRRCCMLWESPSVKSGN